MKSWFGRSKDYLEQIDIESLDIIRVMKDLLICRSNALYIFKSMPNYLLLAFTFSANCIFLNS